MRSLYEGDVHDYSLEHYIHTDKHTSRVRSLFAWGIHDKYIDNSNTTYTQSPRQVE
jgi:hypothetical protein